MASVEPKITDSEALSRGQFESRHPPFSPPPPCHLLTLSKQGAVIYSVKKDVIRCEDEKKEEVHVTPIKAWVFPDAEIVEFSPLGNWLALANRQQTVTLVDLETPDVLKTLATLPTGSCKRLLASPKGTYLGVLLAQTTNKENNFSVYHVASQQRVLSFTASSAPEKWPPLVWSDQESYCFRQTPNALIIYEGALKPSLTEEPCWKPTGKLSVDNLQTFSVASEDAENGSIKLATFTPPRKDKPGKVEIFRLNSPQNPTFEVLNSKSFFQVQDVKLKWNFSGTALLALAQRDHDTSGKSYYGTSSLYYIKATLNGPSFQLVSCEKGPVADCQWSPTADAFVMISGPMPPAITMHDGKTGDAILSFGSTHRNCIRFNPFGRFICLAGFGNMAGNFDIWDKNAKKVIGAGKAPCTVDCEWAPDGRMLLFAVTTPRMRVDNGITILKYTGKVLHKLDIPDLYNAWWLPSPKGVYTDRPASRVRKTAAAAASADTESEQKPLIYRPPGASDAFQARLRAMRMRDAEPQKVATVISTASEKKLPPGALFVDAGPSKSARRKAARRRKNQEAAEEAAAAASGSCV